MSIASLTTGTAYTQEYARLALPYLVRLAEAEQTITYSALADALGMKGVRPLGRILGEIGSAIEELNQGDKQSIPPIQSLVLNKSKSLPGDGIAWYTSIDDFNALSELEQRKWLRGALNQVYGFPKWREVLSRLGLEPLTTDFSAELDQAIASRGGGGGEGPAHLALKVYVANHPEVVKLLKRTPAGAQEYPLASGDLVDVLFKTGDGPVAVEVKSIISSKADVTRGIYQCVKYRAVLKAQQLARTEEQRARAVLVLEGSLPDGLKDLCILLGVEVFANVKPS